MRATIFGDGARMPERSHDARGRHAMSPISILMVVVFPAPFGPREAEDLPARHTDSDTPRTASTSAGA